MHMQLALMWPTSPVSLYACLRFVVVTLPLGVLKAGKVQFYPSLAVADRPKALAIERLGAAVYNKVRAWSSCECDCVWLWLFTCTCQCGCV